MDSGAIGNSGNDLISRARARWTENSKVYTRRKRKKTPKTSINYEKATTTATENPITSSTSITENPAAADVPVTENPNGSAADVPVTENPNGFAAAVSPAIIPGSPTVTTTALRNSSGNVVKELAAPAADDGNSAPKRLHGQSQHQERTSSHTPVAEDEDFSQKQLQGSSRHQEQMPVPILSKDDSSGQCRVHESVNGHGPQGLSESSPLANANELPNGREVSLAQFPGGGELPNGGEATAVPSPLPSGNEPVNVKVNAKPLVITRVDDRVTFNLSKATPRDDIRGLKRKLESELDQVRRLVKQFGAKDCQFPSIDANIDSSMISSNNIFTSSIGGNFGGYIQSQPQYVINDAVEKRVLVRVNAEVGKVGHLETRPVGLARVNSDVGATRHLEPRLYNRQLSVAVMENNHRVGEFVEKEKRTPKANQYYRNSEFLLGKDRLPPESNKKSKANSGRKRNRDGFGFGFMVDKNRNQVYRSCSNLLQKLMKHKHAWVFNEPVDVKGLGLHDYHDIIKHPMDLGTIKNRLSYNMYKSPREFAEDVRLVFRNAMTYNPKGQDVHAMAEKLSDIFEERWAVIETEYDPYWKYHMYQGAGLPSPTARKAAPYHRFAPASAFAFTPAPTSITPHAPSAHQMMTLDRSESVATPISVDPKIQRPHVGRTPVPKKPKAKDPNKRDMTPEEKQKLSKNLQSLPPEKLDAIVQIVKKRNAALSQNDTEIEVDIDIVDVETLWELDRLVTNYKKSLSKIKRRAELARARAGANLTAPVMSTTPLVAEVQIESEQVGKSTAPPPAVQSEKQGYNESRSSSSSSSSSDSSSSDSDSDSSSADGSDAGHSSRM